eukprot:TRINITY_DN501_c0_g1_i3.p1 TRINITY_DN501_c0_g1~~TRINITY_DN501_c0_g1_i3.p1  ORF type:complete len:141 (-),score=26.08 TRINITY_DN501_c0_g1_i3:731-1153(-)
MFRAPSLAILASFAHVVAEEAGFLATRLTGDMNVSGNKTSGVDGSYREAEFPVLQHLDAMVASTSGGFTAFLEKQRNLCLSVDGNRFQNGAKLQAWTCQSSTGQLFEYSPNDKTLRAVHDPSYCVVTDSNRFAPSTKAQL